MKTKMFILVFVLLVFLIDKSIGQSALLKNWVEYLQKTPDGGKKPVEVAELIFYHTDKNGNIMDEIGRPNLVNPVSLDDIHDDLITLKTSGKKEESKKLRKTSTGSKKEALDFNALTSIKLIHEKSQIILLDGKREIVVNHEDIADQCIGKFIHEGVGYAVTLTMKKAILDRGGKLVFI